MRTHQPLEEKNSHSHTDVYAFTLCIRIRSADAKEKRGVPKKIPFALTFTHSLSQLSFSLFILPFQSLQMVRTRSTSMAKGKAKLSQHPTRASPRLAVLRSNIAVQIPTPTPDVLAKETVTSTLPPKKRQSFRMAGESSSISDTKTTCRRPRRLAVLYSSANQCRKKKWSSRSLMTRCRKMTIIWSRMKQCQLQNLPKNDVYDALWAMLGAESEAEEIPGEWDLDSVL
ncbi:hypothetical protein PIB30_035290 [Stylosanthes scabra]|uniref:Uncharacterized protein n=1 Tax=Stylosanthes scabra TaxID=79078 RepID=A0ABU6YBN9_9FABA|nr:hypothetical protein [Stylosanthes scabra]